MTYEDKEKRRATLRKYYLSHVEQRKEYARHYRTEHSEYAKQWENSHRENGLCIHCNQPQIKDSIYCFFHLYKVRLRSRKSYRKPENLERKRIYGKTRKDRLKSENKCVSCSMPLDEESRMGILCLNCYNSFNKTGY